MFALLFHSMSELRDRKVSPTRRAPLLAVHPSHHQADVVTKAIWSSQVRLIDKFSAVCLALALRLDEVTALLSAVPIEQLDLGLQPCEDITRYERAAASRVAKFLDT